MLVLASCNHQKSKLRAVAGAEGFWVAELRVRQLKIVSKSCFGIYVQIIAIVGILLGQSLLKLSQSHTYIVFLSHLQVHAPAGRSRARVAPYAPWRQPIRLQDRRNRWDRGANSPTPHR